ncbi:hypothetical protein [Bacillus sp. REN10]|uniref:hypothetical protein n=1 Tax=Bacillus sp. REN10 TaxID=2782541 RepID=UPI00193BB187|nr:hypothetical protein [Bacillus sp. REN10]
MYLVIVKNVVGGHNIKKFESLDEAKEEVKKCVEFGKRDVAIAQEIPMKLKVEVEC